MLGNTLLLDAQILFRRGGLVGALNTSASSIALPPGEVLLTSSPLIDGRLAPDSAAWLG
ncbi:MULTISPECIES: hypothetical protein [unclassified Amycolatopsis]|uniref:hypothetical protein n=1 Tax=unclassified Amycolatopsis TaxID=2618356 RepID=UPI001430D088|nr:MULTISPECIES: hypothetical protein [unclassified Amycolatopsis]